MFYPLKPHTTVKLCSPQKHNCAHVRVYTVLVKYKRIAHYIAKVGVAEKEGNLDPTTTPVKHKQTNKHQMNRTLGCPALRTGTVTGTYTVLVMEKCREYLVNCLVPV